VTKRSVDILVAALGLIVLAPVFAVIAGAIKFTSPGPIFFRQERVGRSGIIFRIFKFRSMVVDAPLTGPPLTIGDDPRLTNVGRILRKSKLDEIPQLINVLRGEMSLVGPRPEVPRYVAAYPREARERVLSVRPGMTDQAAVSLDEERLLAAATDAEWTYVHRVLPRKIALYEQYVARHGLLVDIAIIGRTLLHLAVSPPREPLEASREGLGAPGEP